MTQAETNKSKQTAKSLLDAETVDDLESIIDSLDALDWEPLGGQENNYGVVENQAGDPIPALVEIVVNSFDAILMKNYREKFGSTESKERFKNVNDAAETLLADTDETVEIVADGEKSETVNFTVVDSGMGQPQEKFNDTFLGLLEPGKFKQDYNFLQGQYGMGSSGVLQFCENGYKFIASAGHENPNEWSWSLIRQNREQSRYEYLTIGDEVPTFSGEFKGRESGTFTKMYDYQLTVGKSKIADEGRFKRKLEKFLVDPPMSITLRDKRYQSSAVSKMDTPGLRGRLERYDHLVKNQHTIQYEFDNKHLGVRDVEVFTFKTDEELEDVEATTRRGKNRFRTKDDQTVVLFTVNGQTHGRESTSFLKHRCNKPQTGEDMIVIVDFSDIAGTDMVDLFQPTRDRIKNSQIGEELRNGLIDAIKNDDWLSAEEQRRRSSLAKESNEEMVSESIESILSDNPDLADYFETGEAAAADIPDDTETDDYNPPETPTTLKVYEKYNPNGESTLFDGDGDYTKEVPVNKTGKIRFKLNAPNDYFDRHALQVAPHSVSRSRSLSRGLFTLTVEAPESVEAGDSKKLTVKVARPDSSPLTETVQVEFIEAEEETETSTSTSSSSSKSGSGGVALPSFSKVGEEKWEQLGFTENDIVAVHSYGEGVSDLQMYINTDAAPFKKFLDSHSLSDSGKEFVEQRYVISSVLYATGMYIEFNKDTDGEVTDEVETAMKGVGQTMLPQVIDDETLSQLSK